MVELPRLQVDDFCGESLPFMSVIRTDCVLMLVCIYVWFICVCVCVGR